MNELSIEQIAQLSKRVKPLRPFIMDYAVVVDQEEIISTLDYTAQSDKKVFDYVELAVIEVICEGKSVADASGPAFEMFSQYELLSQVPECFLRDIIGYSFPREYWKTEAVKNSSKRVSFEMQLYKGKLSEEIRFSPMMFNGKKF